MSHLKKQPTDIYRRFGHFLTPTFIIFLITGYYLQWLLFEVLALYGVMSLMTLILYAWDKSAAQANRWRTKESTLQLLALCGGWPGAFYAQCWLRHKSRKPSFQRMFWVCVVLNIGIFAIFLKLKFA